MNIMSNSYCCAERWSYCSSFVISSKHINVKDLVKMLSVRQMRKLMSEDGFSLEILRNQHIDWNSLILLYVTHLILLLCIDGWI